MTTPTPSEDLTEAQILDCIEWHKGLLNDIKSGVLAHGDESEVLEILTLCNMALRAISLPKGERPERVFPRVGTIRNDNEYVIWAEETFGLSMKLEAKLNGGK